VQIDRGAAPGHRRWSASAGRVTAALRSSGMLAQRWTPSLPR